MRAWLALTDMLLSWPWGTASCWTASFYAHGISIAWEVLLKLKLHAHVGLALLSACASVSSLLRITCAGCRYEMFEEAFEIYKKFGLKTKAIKVLLEQMEDLARAQEYATKVCMPALPCPVLLSLHQGLTGNLNGSWRLAHQNITETPPAKV